MLVRLQKIISSHGVTSRRDAEKMIAAGRVTVNGVQAILGQSAQADTDLIEIDGMPLVPVPPLVHIMLNKPLGYVTTMKDERNRKTVTSLVGGVGERIYPVGRLDIDSSGLLLLTNDGSFAHTIMHPSYSVPKTYEVYVKGDLDAGAKKLRNPLEIDSTIVKALSVDITKKTSAGGILVIAISEGRNRQIRKMCDLTGLRVISLKRISIGSVSLGALKPGHWRHLTKEEHMSLVQNQVHSLR